MTFHLPPTLSQEEPLRDFASCKKLGGEDHARAVPGMVAGYLDAGESYFGFWGYLHMGEGWEGHPALLNPGKQVAETSSISQSGVTECPQDPQTVLWIDYRRLQKG